MSNIFKQQRNFNRLFSFILVLVLLVASVPLVSAYEAYTINVKARVKERFNVIKTMRLATAEEIQAAIARGVVFPGDNPNPGVSDPANVPIETLIVWVVTIMFQNPHDYPINNVVITDNFSAEMAGAPQQPTSGLVDLDILTHTAGKAKKKIFETQYRIEWFVTYVSGDVNDNDPPVDNSGTLAPGAEASLQVLVWTKLNPSGRQEYTSPGTYTLNSGPTAKWLDPDGHQFSFEGPSLYVTAR